MKNISKILSIFSLFFSFLILIYVFYRSEYYYSGTKFNYYLNYYILSLFLITLSIISFFIKDSLKIKIGLIFTSIILVFYFIEAYLIFKPNIPKKDLRYKINQYEKKTGNKYDTRTIVQILKDLKQENPKVVLRTIPSDFQMKTDIPLMPLSGVSNRKTILCNENGYYAIYQSDRYGFNNPDQEWDKQKIEFLLLGDSFALGECVKESKNIAGNLRLNLDQKKGILNLSSTGNGPLIEYATLKEYFPFDKTKRVLWMYYEGNDLVNLSVEIESAPLKKYLKNYKYSQNLKIKQSQVDELVLKKEKLKKIKKFIKLYSFRQFIIISIQNISNPNPAPEISQKFKEILKMSKKYSEENGANFYFVYLPQYARYVNNNNNNLFQNYEKVIQIAKSLDIDIVDLNIELFAKQKDPLLLFPFKKIGHYNELGYKLAAEAIIKKIKIHEQ